MAGFKITPQPCTPLISHVYLLTLLSSLREVWEQGAVAIVQIIVGHVIASGVLCHRIRLHFAHRIRSRSSFHAARDLSFTGASHDTSCYWLLPVVSSLWDDEDVEPARHHESKNAPSQQEMPDDETHDVQRVVVEPLEGRVGEAEDDGENGSSEIAEERSPDGR